ncbi:hypothetical protein GW17_00052345 [Ensete ventricosum]|nr:hypothetical protein GW17_00052345 [Ensete ventricosum]RZR83153.1 hypothetical protein BHM03_00009709 [Ensete ventricosum]
MRGRGNASSSSAGTRCCLVLMLEDEAARRLPTLGRGAASFTRWKMRRRLVFLRWDEALPRSSVGRRGGDEAAPRSSYAVTRWCLVLSLEDEASLRLPSVGQGVASFFYWTVRRCLVFQRWDEALPRSS